jgi:hypothetical protein
VGTQVLRVASYWFRVGFARKWTSYLTLVLFVGLVGGIAMGSTSAARRTESSFNVFLSSTNPSDLSAIIGPKIVTSTLSHLAHVRHVATASFSIDGFPAKRDGAPDLRTPLSTGDVATVGALNGEFFTQDKVTVVHGVMADARDADEFVATALAEQRMGWHVGQSIPMYFYSAARLEKPDFGTAKDRPTEAMTMHLVGTVVLNNEVVLDEVDRYPAFLIFTPALTKPLNAVSYPYIYYGLQTDHGASDVATVEREVIKALPRGSTYQIHVTSVVAGQVNRSIEPEAIALGVFGLIAELAMLIIAGGLIARMLQRSRDELELMRALGASPMMVLGAGLMGIIGSVVAGTILSVVMAVALSSLAPIGPVRAVYPHRGVAFDWTVLGIGTAIAIAVLGAMAVVFVRRTSSRSPTRWLGPGASKGSSMARLFANAGFPVTAVVGVRYATESGRDRDVVPARPALAGAALAVMIVVATLTFGNSLNTLISHPALYGWDWNYALSSNGGGIPPQAIPLLRADPYVKSWTGVGFPDVQINGITEPMLTLRPPAKVSPPMLSGHQIESANQIVLGAATMQQLHVRLGDTVVVSYGSKKDAPVYLPPRRLLVVGTATLPAIGNAYTLHPSMGVGAIIAMDVEPPTMRKFIESPYRALDGPAMVLVRLRGGAPPVEALASLRQIARAMDRVYAAVPQGQGLGDSASVLGVQYPAEIENYRSIGATPAVLAFALAAAAVIALGLTLTSSVRRRRRDLALLRTFGLSGRQLRSVVAWQASVVALVGVVVGVPLGILLGQWLWDLFARGIYAVPDSTVPLISVIVVAVGALVLANIVAAWPGRSAARTSTAQVLRDE